MAIYLMPPQKTLLKALLCSEKRHQHRQRISTKRAVVLVCVTSTDGYVIPFYSILPINEFLIGAFYIYTSLKQQDALLLYRLASKQTKCYRR